MGKVQPGEDLSIGAKRNICVYLASGKYIAHFDDDDLYAPHYLVTMISKMEEKRSVAVKLGSWFTMNWETGKFGCVEPLAKVNRGENHPVMADGELFGWGFSYIFMRELALQIPYPDLSQGEDLEFYNEVRKMNCQDSVRPLDPCGTVLVFVTDVICVHTEHKQRSA